MRYIISANAEALNESPADWENIRARFRKFIEYAGINVTYSVYHASADLDEQDLTALILAFPCMNFRPESK